MKYAIVLYSKHTGEPCHLGSQFATMAELQDYVDKQICTRCNRVETVFVPDGAQWVNRNAGFRKS
jgi:hypothetical protein